VALGSGGYFRPSSRELYLGGIDVGDGQLFGQILAVFEHVDGAPIGDLGDGELGHARQGGLVLERLRKGRYRLRQERSPNLFAPPLTGVAKD